MRLLLQKAALAATIFLLSACSTLDQSQLGEPGELKPAQSGFVVATLVNHVDDATSWVPNGSGLVASYYAVDRLDEPAFAITTKYRTHILADTYNGLLRRPGATVPEANGWRVMTMLAVPPGRYRLGRIEANFPIFQKYIHVNVADPAVIEVRAGEVTYLGSIQMRTSTGTTLFGQSVPTAAKFLLYDDAKTDVPSIQAADPRLSKLPVTNAVDKRASGRPGGLEL